MQRQTATSMAPLHHLLLLLLLSLLLPLAGAAADQSGCLAAPAASTAGTIKCDILIVGGGAGGLFAAFMLRHLGNKVCLVEKQPYFGGKLQVIGPGRPMGSSANGSSNPTGVIGTAGMRIDETQPELRCLAQQLGVKADSSESSLLFNVKDRWVRDDTDQLLMPGSPSGKPTLNLSAPGSNEPIPVQARAGMYDRLWEYLIFGTNNTNPLTGQVGPSPTKNCSRYSSVGTYITDVAGRDALKYLWVGISPSQTELVDPIDVCAYMEYARVEATRGGVQYIPQGGFKELLDRARAEAAAKDVRFFAGSPVTCLYGGTAAANGSSAAAVSQQKGDVYVATTADGKHFVAPHLIFASGPLDVKRLGGSLAAALQARAELKSIWPIEVAVYDAFYPQRFWEPFSATMYGNLQVLTTEQCTIFSEFPGWDGLRTVNASRPVYTTDRDCVAFWKCTLASGGPKAARANVTKSLQSLFPQENIPQPTLDYLQVLPDGWHRLAAGAAAQGITSASLAKWATAPLGDRSLCLVGEAYYPLYSGWTQGAWASAYGCVSSNFQGLLPQSAQAANAFINDGCDGVEEFSNEVKVPKRELPGLRPDGGGSSRRSGGLGSASIVTAQRRPAHRG